MMIRQTDRNRVSVGVQKADSVARIGTSCFLGIRPQGSHSVVQVASYATSAGMGGRSSGGCGRAETTLKDKIYRDVQRKCSEA